MEKKKLRRKTQDVLNNRNLISTESANSPSIARRYAKGIVLSQQIGFNQGTFASLKDLKHFYRKLSDGKAPSNSLIVRRAIDLLNSQDPVSKINQTSTTRMKYFQLLLI